MLARRASAGRQAEPALAPGRGGAQRSRLDPEWHSDEFGRLLRRAGLRRITLHDSRHTTLTPSSDAKIDWKALSHRIGHSDVAFTMKQYVQTGLEADRQVANTLAELIIGGSLTSFEITATAHEAG